MVTCSIHRLVLAASDTSERGQSCMTGFECALVPVLARTAAVSWACTLSIQSATVCVPCFRTVIERLAHRPPPVGSDSVWLPKRFGHATFVAKHCQSTTSSDQIREFLGKTFDFFFIKSRNVWGTLSAPSRRLQNRVFWKEIWQWQFLALSECS